MQQSDSKNKKNVAKPKTEAPAMEETKTHAEQKAEVPVTENAQKAESKPASATEPKTAVTSAPASATKKAEATAAKAEEEDSSLKLDATVLAVEDLLPQVRELWHSNWRFVTQTVVDLGDAGFDIIYHFDRDLDLKNYRITVERGTPVPSISEIYFAAMLVENENRDLFGVSYEGLVLDFNRTLYLEQAGDPILAPFCKISMFTKLKCEV